MLSARNASALLNTDPTLLILRTLSSTMMTGHFFAILNSSTLFLPSSLLSSLRILFYAKIDKIWFYYLTLYIVNSVTFRGLLNIT